MLSGQIQYARTRTSCGQAEEEQLLLDSLHAWMVEKNATLSKNQTGRMVQLCTESVGRTLLLRVDGQAEADIMPRKKPFVPSSRK